MIQQEVGARLAATPGTKDYGILSVLLQYHFAMSSCSPWGRTTFILPPSDLGGDAADTPGARPRADNEAFFAQVVKAAFATRRKTLRNTLAIRARHWASRTQMSWRPWRH